MRKLALLMAAVVTLGACDQSKPELEKTLVQVQQISAEACGPAGPAQCAR